MSLSFRVSGVAIRVSNRHRCFSHHQAPSSTESGREAQYVKGEEEEERRRRRCGGIERERGRERERFL